MKLVYKKTDKKPEACFSAKKVSVPCLEQDWHFHPEIELIYFMKSSGTRYVGNSIGNFEEGELYLIGSNVPHLFRNRKEYYENIEDSIDAVDLVVIKFERDFLGEAFLKLPEARAVIKLLSDADRGLKFSRSTTYLVHSLLTGLVGSEGMASIVGLLQILNILSIADNQQFLCSEVITEKVSNNEKGRMASIISHLNQNFDSKIELEEIASVACMTPNAFCRYFKKKTNKSFTQYLNEIRLGNACKLLIDGELSVTHVAYQSGFNTVTNFNRQFKAFMKVTPSEYMRKYQLHGEVS